MKVEAGSRLQYNGVRLICPDHPGQQIERGHPNYHTTVMMKCWPIPKKPMASAHVYGSQNGRQMN
jgi:hypothetical protein